MNITKNAVTQAEFTYKALMSRSSGISAVPKYDRFTTDEIFEETEEDVRNLGSMFGGNFYWMQNYIWLPDLMEPGRVGIWRPLPIVAADPYSMGTALGVKRFLSQWGVTRSVIGRLAALHDSASGRDVEDGYYVIFTGDKEILWKSWEIDVDKDNYFSIKRVVDDWTADFNMGFNLGPAG
jgi:hypothetical protein